MIHVLATSLLKAPGPRLLALVCLASILVCSRGDRDIADEAVAIQIRPSTALLQKQGHNATKASAAWWHSQKGNPQGDKILEEADWWHKKLSNPQETGGWDFRDNTYCSKSDPETIKIHEDQYGNLMKKRQWGRTAGECEKDCRDNPACKAYTFGIWEKGFWRMVGGHNGDTRCQLYSACGENSWKGMTLAYAKDAPVRPAAIVEDEHAPNLDENDGDVGAAAPHIVEDEHAPNLDENDGDVGAGSPQVGGQPPPPPPLPVSEVLPHGGDETVDLGPELQHPGRKKEPEWDGDALFKPGSEGDKQDKLAKKLMQTVEKRLDEQTNEESSVYKAIDKADKEGKAFHALLGKQRDAAAAALGAANVMHKEVDEDTDAMEGLLTTFKEKTMQQDKIISSHPRFSPDFNDNDG